MLNTRIHISRIVTIGDRPALPLNPSNLHIYYVAAVSCDAVVVGGCLQSSHLHVAVGCDCPARARLCEDEKGKIGLLHPVASLHVTLRDKQARRRCLFSGADTFKRALSARADLAIRRQLCNLPVASLEMQQASGFCQWVV
ncbi:hypothetical protein J6590_071825 [Homalodisca vitripennis]|nr:hypothetical protein J6590_071825 [Homalodisca vitripennis]